MWPPTAARFKAARSDQNCFPMGNKKSSNQGNVVCCCVWCGKRSVAGRQLALALAWQGCARIFQTMSRCVKAPFPLMPFVNYNDNDGINTRRIVLSWLLSLLLFVLKSALPQEARVWCYRTLLYGFFFVPKSWNKDWVRKLVQTPKQETPERRQAKRSRQRGDVSSSLLFVVCHPDRNCLVRGAKQHHLEMKKWDETDDVRAARSLDERVPTDYAT